MDKFRLPNLSKTLNLVVCIFCNFKFCINKLLSSHEHKKTVGILPKLSINFNMQILFFICFKYIYV